MLLRFENCNILIQNLKLWSYLYVRVNKILKFILKDCPVIAIKDR
jgi:hypothetical protein